MKKLFSLLFLATVAITVFIISCKKDSRTNFEDQEIVAIDKAKAWYSSHVSKDASVNIQPIWDKAEVKKSKLGADVVIVPASTGNTTDNPTVEMVTSFLFSGNSTGINAGNIVKIIGDAAYIKEQGQNLILKYQNQTVPDLKEGAVIVYDVNQKYLLGGTIKNGAVAKTLRSAIVSSASFNSASSGAKLSSTRSPERLPSTFSTQGEAEVCTNWYYTTWDINTGQILSQNFVYKTCEGAPSGSNGSSTDATFNAPPPCPKSFHFVTKISADIHDLEYEGGWQIAAINGLHQEFISFPGGAGAPTPKAIKMPLLYFGLPVLRKNGTNYTYEAAQKIATDAVYEAEKAAGQAFNNGYMQDALANIYKNKLVERMAAFGGTVSTSPGLNITIPTKDITVPTYPIIFNLNC